MLLTHPKINKVYQENNPDNRYQERYTPKKNKFPKELEEYIR